MWHSRPPRDPPPFMANAILNFHFDFLTPSLMWNFEQFSSLITHCCIPQVQVNKRKYSRTAHISSKFRTFESKSALVGVKGALYWSVLRKILFSWEVEGSAAQFWCFPTSTQIHQAMNSTILNSPLCMDELGFSKIVLAHTLKPLKHDFLINSQFWQQKREGNWQGGRW